MSGNANGNCPPPGSIDTGLVLSGGGSRAAYQVGALRALLPYINQEKNPLSVIIGSSIGAINGLVLGACLKHSLSSAVDELDAMWREREFRNTFSGSPSQAFFRAIRIAVVQYLAPGPNPTTQAIFDPTPLMQRVDSALAAHGGLSAENRHPGLRAIGVMATVEGEKRRGLLFLSSREQISPEYLAGATFDVCYVPTLAAKHGFASAALPSVLPPVELDADFGKVRLVDGGISQNIPVDPAVRLGAQRVLVVDVSGRDWWLSYYKEPQDSRPDWEVAAGLETFCMRPPETFVTRCQKPLGSLLRETVGKSRAKFMKALGPVWPVFSLLKNKLGEEVAYEAMTYVALDSDYLAALIERGYQETLALIGTDHKIVYHRSADYKKWAAELNANPAQ